MSYGPSVDKIIEALVLSRRAITAYADEDTISGGEGYGIYRRPYDQPFVKDALANIDNTLKELGVDQSIVKGDWE